ncbi:MAG: energy transducer TonB [Gammaproteobacteria bacterium]|nr:energy transducer TonB [Gammaproteobacteria bacterium]
MNLFHAGWRLNTSRQRLSLFVVFSIFLHGILLITWKEPLQFDFGGQQQNQQTIEIALEPPTPQQPEPEPEPEPDNETPTVEEKVVIQPDLPEPAPKPTVNPEPIIKEVTKSVIEPAPPTVEKRPQPVEKTAEPTPTRKPKKQYVPFQKKKIEQLRKQADQPKPVPAKPPKPPTPKPKPQLKATQPKPPPKPIPKVETPSKTTQESEAVKQSRATIRRLIQAELVRYFQYPRLARRKGWEGKVHLQFTVQPDGKLTGIKILNGSPFGVLNRSAVDTMKRINHLNQVNEGMLGGPLQMEIPIIYQLK